MTKNTRRQAAQSRKTKNAFTPLTYHQLKELVKTKIISKTSPKNSLSRTNTHNIIELLNEELLTCSICLELLLSPVLADCGHTFCLKCA
jgi:hypothetical protein